MTESTTGIPRARLSTLTSVLLAAPMLLGACGGTDSITGPAAESCGPAPYFDVLPVPASELESVAIFGGVDAPGHTLPTDHGGFFLTHERHGERAGRHGGRSCAGSGTRVRTCRPARRTMPSSSRSAARLSAGSATWSPSRRGSRPTCRLPNCRTYSVIWATVETCEARTWTSRSPPAMSSARAGAVTDFGMRDERVNNFYMSPWRCGGESTQCACGIRSTPRTRTSCSRSCATSCGRVSSLGEPRCGTMEVDVPARRRASGPTRPDPAGFRRGTGYIALVDYPYRPQPELALSLGPESLGAPSIVSRHTSGRVNLAFDQVTPGRQIYCYGPDVARGHPEAGSCRCRPRRSSGSSTSSTAPAKRGAPTTRAHGASAPARCRWSAEAKRLRHARSREGRDPRIGGGVSIARPPPSVVSSTGWPARPSPLRWP